MIYQCKTCRKKFELVEGTTMDNLKELRIVLVDGEYWHKPCAKLVRMGDQLMLESRVEGRITK